MPRRADIKRILVIGSGPIVIGQAAEFDYAGAQACIALREEGYEVILVNSNPATIMTDADFADKVYMEPLTLEYVARIIRKERPDAILPGLGGQTGLNLAMQLHRKGVLDECQTRLLGTDFDSIDQAEDREKFKELCLALGEPVIPSHIATTVKEGIDAAREIGYPVVIRPAFTLGGTGGGFVDSDNEIEYAMARALALSPAHQALVEKSVRGYKEIEFEVMRDAGDTAICVCGMENIDPVGVHTGDSLVVAPIQTLSGKEFQMLRAAALRLIRALKIEGGCNVQFALDPDSFRYYVIEVNPRVSRSSALASKATGYPIARVTAKVAAGLLLKEIDLSGSPACLEPAVDYVVTKAPRFPFDKLTGADSRLGTQMKATGETMSIGRTLEESILKAVRSLENGTKYLRMDKFTGLDTEELLDYVSKSPADRLYALAELCRQGCDLGRIFDRTKVDMLFLSAIKNIVETEKSIENNPLDAQALPSYKRAGFSDGEIARLSGKTEADIRKMRKESGVLPAYRRIDTRAGAMESDIPYFYSTWGEENESLRSDRKKVIVLGAGPIRIGQGIEFDYSTVHAVKTLRAEGYEAILINNNPETVSTDFAVSDKLYFEPLTLEDVMNVIDLEKPMGVVVSLGGQTAVNLAEGLKKMGAPLLGTDADAIELAENRDSFEKIMETLQIPQPKGRAVLSEEEGVAAANEIGYPALVRPSFVLGGRNMQIVRDEPSLRKYLRSAFALEEKKPVLVDRYIMGRELETDAVCDGQDVFIPGIMEHVERTGVHSGDSISVYPPFSVSDKAKKTILDYSRRLGLALHIVGLYNIQFIVAPGDEVYVIEVNPRSSRTVPFLSKATGAPLADIATRAMLGQSLKAQRVHEITPRSRWYVKAPAFSFNKLKGGDAYLSPEMKSTGEAIGYDNSLTRALYKALKSAGMNVQNYGTLLVTLADGDKEEALPLVRRFYNLGFNIEATRGTAEFLKTHGIRTRARRKLSEGSEEILDSIRRGHVAYVINTRAAGENIPASDGAEIRQCAVENNVTMFTALDTVRVMLDVLEETTLGVSTIDDDGEGKK